MRHGAGSRPSPTPSSPNAIPRRKQIGESIRGGASPDGPEVAELRASSTARRRADRSHRRGAGGGRGRARRPAAADPEPRRPRRPGRRRGGQRHDPDLGRAGRARGAGRRRRRLDAAAALGARRGPRHHRQRPRRQDRGLRLPGLQGRGLATAALADLVVPRRPHRRARPDRDLAAGRRQHGIGARHGPDPRQGRPDVRRHSRRAVPGSHRRGPGHQPPPGRDPRGRRAAHPVRRLQPVLPARGGRRRQGHPRHPPRPPVRQGRDGAVREARGQRGGAGVDHGARGGPAPAAGARLPRRADEHPGAGVRAAQEVRPRGLGAGRGALARGQLVLQLRRLPGAPDGDPLPARRPARSPSSSTRSTAPGWRCRGSWPRCSRRTSAPTARSRCPRCCAPTWAGLRLARRRRPDGRLATRHARSIPCSRVASPQETIR